MTNIELFRESFRIIFHRFPINFDFSSGVDENRLLKFFSLLKVLDGKDILPTISVNFKNLLKRYFLRKFNVLSTSEVTKIVDKVPTITSFSLLVIYQNRNEQSVSTFNQCSESIRFEKIRFNIFVATEMDESNHSVDVYYGLVEEIL